MRGDRRHSSLRRSISSVQNYSATPSPSHASQHNNEGSNSRSTSRVGMPPELSTSNIQLQFEEPSLHSYAGSEAVSEEDGDDPYQQLVDSAPDPRHMGHIRRLRAKYKNKEMAGFETEAEFKSQVLEAHAHRRAQSAMADRTKEHVQRRRKSSTRR